jgi:hypothetical protein
MGEDDKFSRDFGSNGEGRRSLGWPLRGWEDNIMTVPREVEVEVVDWFQVARSWENDNENSVSVSDR